MPKLGVNIDHVATVRQARRILSPDPVEAARICEEAGCESIVCHLREDRRHIIDNDVVRLRRSVRTRLNLEMSAAEEIVGIACMIKPDQATLVPEKREEVTTEGGLDLVRHGDRIGRAVNTLTGAGIAVSLFIDPVEEMIQLSHRLGVNMIELHTGAYANSSGVPAEKKNLQVLRDACLIAQALGMTVNAGHGLNYENVRPVARISGIEELNIGHAIVSEAIFEGLSRAVKKMKELIS